MQRRTDDFWHHKHARGHGSLCNTTAALGNGAWVNWPTCNSSQCLWANHSSPYQKPSVALFSSVSYPASFMPRVWAPQSGCALRIRDAEEARVCLDSHGPLLLVGDSTTLGQYHELQLLLSNYRMYPPGSSHGLRYLRVADLDSPGMSEAILKQAAGTSAVVLNVGSHLAKAVHSSTSIARVCNGGAHDGNSSLRRNDFLDRRVPDGPRGWFVDGSTGINYTRHVLVGRYPTGWHEALLAARLSTRGASCDAALLGEAIRARDQVAQLFRSLRRSGYGGRLFWRSIQINFGFENSLKLKLNTLLGREWLTIHWDELGAELLDIERLTASRPETFFHEHTNHFFCVCPHAQLGERGNGGLDIRERCTDSPHCDQRLRASFYDNGEPNRYLAQMTLHAVCDTLATWPNKQPP
mgnify:CR=1 FL=1